jgi:hypothetical protein
MYNNVHYYMRGMKQLKTEQKKKGNNAVIILLLQY